MLLYIYIYISRPLLLNNVTKPLALSMNTEQRGRKAKDKGGKAQD